MCISPIILKNKQVKFGKNKYTVPVPCGRCPECVKAKINSWLFRLDKELMISSSPLFVTLTYDEEHVPVSLSGQLTLCKRDVQLFMKRLRFAYSKVSKKKIKFYACGEYGSRTHRPHYHMIMFNMDNPELIHECWQNGFTYAPPLSDGGMGYVLKYMSKQRKRRDDNDDKLPEFSLMSLRLGANYLTEAIKEYHNRGVEFCSVSTKEGYKMAMPKYYKDKIYSEEMRKEVTYYLQKRAELLMDEQLAIQKRKNPRMDEKLLRRNLELSKLHKKFDKRIEVL